jgi:serine/threonine-protein kinase 24/25/MST4
LNDSPALIASTLICHSSCFQRPTAKELLKYQFIKKAKKNAYLIDLIDRFKKWKNQKGEESETESENSDS